MKRSTIAQIILAVAATVGLALGCGDPAPGDASGGETVQAGQAAQAEAVAERRQAPDFSLESLDGQSVRLTDLRGKTVVIDFWATWCPPCEFQVPELNAFWNAHPKDRLGINDSGLNEIDGDVPTFDYIVKAVDFRCSRVKDEGEIEKCTDEDWHKTYS